MGWDNITGDAKIIPSSGNMNEVRFESGKPKKIRLLLREGEQPTLTWSTPWKQSIPKVVRPHVCSELSDVPRLLTTPMHTAHCVMVSS